MSNHKRSKTVLRYVVVFILAGGLAVFIVWLCQHYAGHAPSWQQVLESKPRELQRHQRRLLRALGQVPEGATTPAGGEDMDARHP